MAECKVTLKDVHLHIPVFAPNQLRLIRKSLFSSAIGGNIGEQNGKVHVHALQGVSFELKQGEHLALIGRNGSGKTTLLKLIAGIYPATSGDVMTQGSLGCLIDLEAGITPEMTGYECIQFQHLMLGDPNEDWHKTAEEVADFTELGGFLELPVRTYSAGMRARLTAAIATAWPRDILLIDEGIGAGDSAFQDKFQARVNNLLEKAGLLLIASHSPDLLRKYCSLGLVLLHGEVRMLDNLETALDYYMQNQ